MIVKAGSTDVSTYVVLRSESDGKEVTGATITDINLQYCRSGASPSTKVDATALTTPDSLHTDNKAVEVDATDQPGLYRVDWPDAAFAVGVREVWLSVQYAGCNVVHIQVELSPAVDAVAISGDTVAADNCELMFDGTGYAGGTTKLKVDLETIKTRTVTCGANVTVYAYVGTTVAIDVNAGGCVGIDWGNVENKTTSNVLSNTTIYDVSNASTLAAAVDAVWDEVVTSDHTTAGSSGKLLGDNLNAPVATIDTVVDSILADTNELQSDWANGGRLDLILDSASAPTAAAVADAVWDEALSGHLTAGTTGTALSSASSGGDPWNTVLPGAYGAGTAGYLLDNIHTDIGTVTADVAAVHIHAQAIIDDVALVHTHVGTIDTTVANIHDTDLPAVKTDTAAILTDTGTTLDGAISTIDAVVDAIKVQTDKLVFTVAGKVDSNVYTWNGSAVATPDTAGYPKVTIKAGTGTGEINLASGRADGNITYIGGVALNTGSAQIGVNLVNWKGSAAPAMTGDAYARLGAPAGASVSADVAAVKIDTAAIKVKTDYLPSIAAGSAGGVFIAGANAATTVDITGSLSGSVSSVTGAVSSVTGAVGSVTGNVGGNVAGSVGSVIAAVVLPTGTGAGQISLTNGAVILTPAYDAAKTAGSQSDVTAIKAKTDGLNFTGAYIQAQVKGQDNIDFGALQKTSLNAATPLVTVSDKTGFSLTAAYDAAKTAAPSGAKMDLVDAPSATAIATFVSAIFAQVVEGSHTVLRLFRIILAGFGGKSSGGGTGTEIYRDTGDTKNRIIATVDENGNRTNIIVDGS